MIQLNNSTFTYVSKGDPHDLRLGDYISDLNLTSPDGVSSLAILGYPSDAGVIANGGRAGAKLGPDSIRQFFYRLTPHPKKGHPDIIWDFGNASVDQLSLQQIDQSAVEFTKSVANRIQKSCSRVLPICLGGGHEFGYASLLPFLPRDTQDWVVINVDAHLDVRPCNGVPHSGTPFYRLIEEVEGFATHFLEWGVQPSSASSQHLEWVQRKGGSVVFEYEGLDQVKKWLDLIVNSKTSQNKTKCYLSVDIDAFSACLAPGCSAPQPQGISLESFNQLLTLLQPRFELAWLGLFEVAPELDGPDQRTSRLAAQVCYNAVTELWCQKQKQS